MSRLSSSYLAVAGAAASSGAAQSIVNAAGRDDAVVCNITQAAFELRRLTPNTWRRVALSNIITTSDCYNSLARKCMESRPPKIAVF